MSFHQRNPILVGAFILGCVSLVPRSSSALDPAHLTFAVEVADNVTPALNEYGSSPSYVTWPGYLGSTVYSNRSVCTTFVTLVLMRAYTITGSEMSAWFGTASPTSAMYHDAIVAQNGFTVVPTIDDVEPGDFLAAKYAPGGSVSGHLATIVSEPVQRIPATNPLVSETFQYDVTVVDSSSSGHGPTDTRNLPVGGWDAGVGIGVMRLYVDALGTIVGHTWSTNNGTFYNQSQRHMVMGRFIPD